MTSEAALHRQIAILPGVIEQKPHTAGTRITVQNIVIWHEQVGLSVDEIAYEALAWRRQPTPLLSPQAWLP